MTQPALLFVYGSLRLGSGHAMSRWLEARARHLGAAVMPQAALYRVSWYPGMVAGEGEVRGDLFQLRDPGSTLHELDAFEDIRGEPGDEYERRLASVQRENGEAVTAWVYWYRLPVVSLATVTSGDWLAG